MVRRVHHIPQEDRVIPNKTAKKAIIDTINDCIDDRTKAREAAQKDVERLDAEIEGFEKARNIIEEQFPK